MPATSAVSVRRSPLEEVMSPIVHLSDTFDLVNQRILQQVLAAYEKSSQEGYTYSNTNTCQAHSRYTLVPEGLLSAGYTQVKPILVTVEPDGDGYVATAACTSLFGTGDTKSESVDDLHSLIVDDFVGLLNSAGALGKHLRRELDNLKDIFVRV